MRSWRAYRANRTAQIIGFSLVALFLSTQLMPEHLRTATGAWIQANGAFSVLLFVSMVLLMVVPTLNLINWRCPRCGELFSYPARSRDACQGCGLAKFADAQNVPPAE